MKQYAIVIERVPGGNYCASVLDLPGCVSTGDKLEEVKRNIKEAIEFHLEGMREDGLPIPEPTTEAAYAEVA
ncbi:MAG: type II toxin-antitoxin system HicB family antitoxin [Acidobacteriota bacterium]|nr:type II toxin-antitoxin system HicB family antitoxin [Acidobacteriota bacterium]